MENSFPLKIKIQLFVCLGSLDILFFKLSSVLLWHMLLLFGSFLQPQYIINLPRYIPLDVCLYFKLSFVFLGMKIRGLHFIEERRNVQTLERYLLFFSCGRFSLFDAKCQV